LKARSGPNLGGVVNPDTGQAILDSERQKLTYLDFGDKLKLSETVRLNLGTASTLAVATSVRGEVVELDLKKAVAIESGMRAAISRRIADRWRLIGSGVLK
ncbi:MAG: hypothetical protein JRN42_08140, partial [Nitrososphaerota archaeon]|nr:hypothetical protein [Nitrososphaerota archaeon]